MQVDQSILGRMLDYGTVTILGTGEGFETLRTIAGPIKLRNCITGTRLGRTHAVGGRAFQPSIDLFCERDAPMRTVPGRRRNSNVNAE